MKSDGVIVVLSYPDTVVRPAHSEFSSKVWPLLGIGSKNGVQAGHAALLLIDKKSGSVNYFDFGRYITTYGFGRVRSKETDVELEMPLKAVFQNDKLLNVDKLLLWLNQHPEKTHGEGRLVASVNKEINYSKASLFIQDLISKKEIPYGAFVKGGSNCARFVTDTIIASCLNKTIVRKLKTSNLLTPSPIGNAIKGSSEKDIYVVVGKGVVKYLNRSVLKEYFSCFLNKFDVELNLIGTELPNKDVFSLEKATWLGGIGSGAWFQIESKDKECFKIARYTSKGTKDFKGLFKTTIGDFDLNAEYKFVHPTNCKQAFVIQKNKEYVFNRVS